MPPRFQIVILCMKKCLICTRHHFPHHYFADLCSVGTITGTGTGTGTSLWVWIRVGLRVHGTGTSPWVRVRVQVRNFVPGYGYGYAYTHIQVCYFVESIRSPFSLQFVCAEIRQSIVFTATSSMTTLVMCARCITLRHQPLSSSV